MQYPEYPLLDADVAINHLITVNKCELEATLLAFCRIIDAEIADVDETDDIALYTDSRFI